MRQKTHSSVILHARCCLVVVPVGLPTQRHCYFLRRQLSTSKQPEKRHEGSNPPTRSADWSRPRWDRPTNGAGCQPKKWKGTDPSTLGLWSSPCLDCCLCWLHSWRVGWVFGPCGSSPSFADVLLCCCIVAHGVWRCCVLRSGQLKLIVFVSPCHPPAAGETTWH